MKLSISFIALSAVWLTASIAVNGCGRGSGTRAGDEGEKQRDIAAADAVKNTDPMSFGRIDASPGSPLVLTLDLLRDVRSRLYVRLVDGRVLPCDVHRVVVSSPAAGSSGTDGWIPTSGDWYTSPVAGSEDDKQLAALRVAVINIPTDTVGDTIFIDERAHRINYLVDPDSLAQPTSAMWPPLMTDAAARNGKLLARLREIAKSPLQRWRVRLLIDGMRSAAAAIPYENPVIEAMAAQVEHRWRLALARLAATNPELSLRIRKRLCAVADFGDGVYAPVWPTDQSSLDRLLIDLLDPKVKIGALMVRAEQWLAEQPQGAVWVIDDGGALTAGKLPTPIPFIGVTNLAERATTAWAYLGSSPPLSPDLRPLAPFGTLTLVPARTEAAGGGESAENETCIVHVGQWTAGVAVITALTPVLPPSLNIQRFEPDLTLENWLYAQPRAVEREWKTAALLYRAAPDARRGAGEGDWELFVECKLVPGRGVLANEAVAVHIGPTTSPAFSFSVDVAGNVRSLNDRAPIDEGLTRAKVVRGRDSWSVRLELPAGSVERSGVLRIGLTRRDSLNRRSAWPLAMLPWQELPARAGLETSGWSGLRVK